MATLSEKLKEYYYNNTTSVDINITLKSLSSCTEGLSDVADFSQIIYANTAPKINFPKDGTYQILVDGIPDTTLGVTIPYYKGLFDSMILYVKASLCGETGINCLAVTQCTGDTNNILNTAISKEILFMSSYGTRYYAKPEDGDCAGPIASAMAGINCSSKTMYDKLYLQETLLGVSAVDGLLKIQIAELYLSMYKYDSSNFTSTETLDEIKASYSYTEIIPCINRLGINENTVIAEPCGIPHTASIKAVPIYTERGVLTSIAVTYNLNPKDDTFITPLDSNITGVTDVSSFDGFDKTVIMYTAQDITYYINYTYKRGNSTDTGRVEVSIDAREPQWFGGESIVSDFTLNNTIIDESALVFTNTGVKKYQSNSNATTSNYNTQGKYIWWITKNKVDIAPSGLGSLPQGDFNTTDCSVGAPSTYAIVWKEGDVRLVDGTVITYNFYRTCPIQDLDDQTAINEITQR